MESRKTTMSVGNNRKVRTRARAVRTPLLALAALMILIASMPAQAGAQITFESAINLAARNSPKVRSAQNDVVKAQAGVAIAKDIYIPSVVVGGGLGDSYGITLTVPTIFTINTQSLVFSFQQRSYSRAARYDLQAAKLALSEAEIEVEEDAAITYLTMENSENVVATMGQQYEIASKLVSIVQDRVNGKLDSELELKKMQRGVLQIELQQMQAEDDLAGLRQHLSQLTGVPEDEVNIVPDSIPPLPHPERLAALATQPLPDTPGFQAALMSDKAKAYRARGDAQYTWRPIVTFGAQYGRISPIQNVSDFYNLRGIYNTISAGVQVQFPLFDKVRRDAAKQTLMDSSRSSLDLRGYQFDQGVGRRKLARSLTELSTKAQLADLDYSIAQEELQSTTVQTHASTGGPPLTPKDEQNARMVERQRFLDMLDAKLQLAKAEISLMRQTDQLSVWLQSVKPAAPPQP